jgi:guanylate kinase
MSSERTVQHTTIARRGFILILSSPSGAGKTTLTRLLEKELGVRLSISVTTRPRRASEVDGVHYRFIGLADFTKMRERGELLEWAEVHGNFYGTPLKPVEDALAAGNDILFDIDWQGTEQVTAKMRDDVVTIFVLPPSMVELKARLERRAEDEAAVIARRLQNARDEIVRWSQYDYVLVNDDIDRAFHNVRAILEAERHKRGRQLGLAPFVEALLSERT